MAIKHNKCFTAILTNSNHQHNGMEGTKKKIYILTPGSGFHVELRFGMCCAWCLGTVQVD